MNCNDKKNDCGMKNNFVINNKPVKLLNNGTNMCWWNSFVQLFSATRNIHIINLMNKFITTHNCGNNNECWYCNIMNDFITIMTYSNDSTCIDFNKYLFDNPECIKDRKSNRQINHPFSVFERNAQQGSFEGCNKWFEV